MKKWVPVVIFAILFLMGCKDKRGDASFLFSIEPGSAWVYERYPTPDACKFSKTTDNYDDTASYHWVYRNNPPNDTVFWDYLVFLQGIDTTLRCKRSY